MAQKNYDMNTFSRLRKTSRDDGDRSKTVLAASDVNAQIFAKLIVTLRVKKQSKHVGSHEVCDIIHT
jgi:hypothetical protein